MVFAIPDWEDGNVRKDTAFSEKTNRKQKNGSPQKKPHNKKSQNTTKVKGVSEKSKVINKENKKKLRIQKQKGVNENNSNSQSKPNTGKHNNGITTLNSKKRVIGKLNTKISKKLNKEKSRNRNVKKDISDSLKVENLDTDKLDEVLLNAKKKKFNEALAKDDVEDLLFKEDKSPEAKNKKQQPKQKNKQLLQNNSSVKGNGGNDPKENINKSSILTRQDKKKNKLKLILKAESNRNPINFNRNKLRERMLDRLKSAQFRFLNEKLYTSSGSEASQLFQNDPAAFQNYHEGYQQQVKKWPVNPLDVIVKRIQKMPKSHLIADMGCGSAALAQRIPHAVRSFDLLAAAPGVEACDMAHTPLLTGSMDAVVYCLALMGTELTMYLLEANRVLKMGGHLLIAEVESRFTDVNAFTKEVSRLGFKLQKINNEHEVFFFMEFVKNQDPPVKKSKLPVLTLKPCIYKRR